MFKNKFHWGPLVLVYDVDQEGFKNIFNLCQKTKSPDLGFRDKFKGVTSINGRWVFDKEESYKIVKEIKPYVNDYIYNLFQGTKPCINANIGNIWMNSYKCHQGINNHIHGSDLSFILYINTEMEKLKDDFFDYAGFTVFEYGEFASFNALISNNNSIKHFPKEGELLIFPGNLRHSSNPFNNPEVERLVLSGNINLELC